MTLQPNFLPVGSIVEYNLGDIYSPEWEVNTIDFEDIRICVENNERFNRNYRPIKLTPEILTEWCNASNKLTEQYRIGERLFIISLALLIGAFW